MHDAAVAKSDKEVQKKKSIIMQNGPLIDSQRVLYVTLTYYNYQA